MNLHISLSLCHLICRSLRSKTSVPQCLSGCFSVLRKCYHILPESEHQSQYGRYCPYS